MEKSKRRWGKISVTPKNWQDKTADMSRDWMVFYRYYDQTHPKGRLIRLKSMNSFKTLRQRQQETKNILADELYLLEKRDYNPITGVYKEEEQKDALTISAALRFALPRLDIIDTTRRDISNMLKRMELPDKPISELKTSDVVLTLEKTNATNCSYNHYRTYLQMLLNYLVSIGQLEYNPVNNTKPKKEDEKIREVLTFEQREFLNEYLTKYPAFHRFLHIFFASGTRIKELMSLRTEDVDIDRRRFKVRIRKGGYTREVWKVIKDTVYYEWVKAMEHAGRGQYVFSKGLVPGDKPIRADQITHRWYRLVKCREVGPDWPYKITADFYSLKHTHSDEVAAILSLKDSQAMNSHRSERTARIYAIGENERQMERLRKVNNSF